MQKAHLPCVLFVRWVGGSRHGKFWALKDAAEGKRTDRAFGTGRFPEPQWQGQSSKLRAPERDETAITISGNLSADAKRYQERIVERAIRESKS